MRRGRGNYGRVIVAHLKVAPFCSKCLETLSKRISLSAIWKDILGEEAKKGVMLRKEAGNALITVFSNSNYYGCICRKWLCCFP